MSNLVSHAKKELELAGLFGKETDFYGGNTGKAVLELIKVFAKQGHSGMSAGIVVSLFKTLASYKTISPLTGEDSEWNDVGNGQFQNNRCSRVFKGNDRFNGKAYDIDGKIFSDDKGRTWFTNHNSFIPITFPYDTDIEPIKVILNPIQVFIRNISYFLKYDLKKVFKKKPQGPFVGDPITCQEEPDLTK